MTYLYFVTLIVDLLADNETLWKILPIESQNSAAGDWGTLGKTMEIGKSNF